MASNFTNRSVQGPSDLELPIVVRLDGEVKHFVQFLPLFRRELSQAFDPHDVPLGLGEIP